MASIRSKVRQLRRAAKRSGVSTQKVMSLLEAEVVFFKKELAAKFRIALTSQFDRQKNHKETPWTEMVPNDLGPRAKAVQKGYYHRGWGGKLSSRPKTKVHPNAKYYEPLLMLSGTTRRNINNNSFKVVNNKLLSIEDLDFGALGIDVDTAEIIKEQKKRGRDCTKINRSLMLPIIESAYVKTLDRIIARLKK
jgi:hypothetical protein